MLKINSFVFSLSLITISCSSLPLSQKNLYCSFPESNPYPGGLINFPLVTDEEITQRDINTDGLKIYLCNERSGKKNILVPLPLTFKNEEVSIYLKNKKIVSLKLEDKFYRESRITIQNQEFVSPPVSLQERIKKEYHQGQEAIKTYSIEKQKSMRMLKPVEGIISSEFGVRRFINGEPRNRHIGLDIAAEEGTPLFSPLEGKVILIGNFFYKGNVVYVDHGNGLVSSFSHLSAIDVKEGQMVSSQELLGRVGSTGRVTGPHVHWEVSFLGVPINPAIFLAE